MKFEFPLTQEQIKERAARTKPSAEDVQRAQDELFMNLLQRVAELEKERDQP